MAFLKSVASHITLRVFPRCGLGRLALPAYDRLLSSGSSFWSLREATDIAARRGDTQRVFRYAQMSMKLFPKQPFGFLVAAKQLILDKKTEEAKRLLQNAPPSAAVKTLLAGLRSKEKRDDLYTSPMGGSTIVGDPNDVLAQSKAFLLKNPYSWKAYEAIADAFLRKLEPAAVVRLLKFTPKIVRNNLEYHIKMASSLDMVRDQLSAVKSLLSAQSFFPGETRILHRLADLYSDDDQEDRARTFYLAARVTNPVFGTVKLLSFEANHGRLDRAVAALDVISTFEPWDRARFLPNWNRVSALFPDQSERFVAWRQEARKLIGKRAPKNGTELDELLSRLLKARWIGDCKVLIDRAASQGISPGHRCFTWLTAVQRRLGSVGKVLDIADINEQGMEIIGIVNGAPMVIDVTQYDKDRVVEFFIPTAFFADPEEEKSSYEAVRVFMEAALEQLLDTEDIIVVPRHQYNWRNAFAKLGGKVISYHTSGDVSNNRLHIQEAPLSGRCSLDNKGFAGYASTASDFATIELKTIDISSDELDKNQNKLFSHYAEGNVSKYAQATKIKKIDGKYVFVALQIPTDVVADLAHVNGILLLQTVAEHYSGSGTRVVVKRHPYCRSMSVQREIERLENEGQIETSDGSIHNLISGAEVVFTVNSGVGLEALIHMKPVVVTGECDYAYAVAAKASSVDELKGILGNQILADQTKIKRLLHFYRNQYTVEAEPIAAKAAIAKWLDQGLNS